MVEGVRLLEVGEMAPDFTLKDQNGKDFKLYSFRGKRVVIAFHPLAWTGVCAKQIRSLETHKQDFDNLNAVAIGISVDSVPTKETWAKDLEIKDTRMLSDFWPHGHIARLYGVLREEDGIAQRSVFIVDETGKIAFSRVYQMSELPDIHETLDALKRLPQPATSSQQR